MEVSWKTAGAIRRPPDAPSAKRPAPSASVTTTGAMLLSGFTPPLSEFGRPGRGSNQ